MKVYLKIICIIKSFFVADNLRLKRENNANVLVISGISGAGKTVLADGLKEVLIKKGGKVAVLDGDNLRTFFGGILKYSVEERIMVSKILTHSAYLLSKNGINVIMATMLSQREAREFINEKIDYYEIHLKAELSDCIDNDPKGIYENNLNVEKPNIVGHDIDFHPSENPDLIIHTHSETPQDSLKRIIKFLSNKNIFGFS